MSSKQTLDTLSKLNSHSYSIDNIRENEINAPVVQPPVQSDELVSGKKVATKRSFGNNYIGTYRDFFLICSSLFLVLFVLNSSIPKIQISIFSIPIDQN